MSTFKAWSVPVVLAVAAGLLCAPPATAKCAPGGSLSIWPPPGPIPSNPRFVLTAHRTMAPFESEIEPCTLFLASQDSDEICLVPETRSAGVFERQVVLRPERWLELGATYVIRYAGDGDRTKDVRSLFERWRWTAVYADDVLAPRWLDEPVVTSTVYRPLGCGTEAGADVRVEAEDEGDVMAWAAVRAKGLPDRQSRYLVPIRDGSVYLGKSMCGGVFHLRPGVSYRATLVPVDISGNAGAARTVDFTIPSDPR